MGSIDQQPSLGGIRIAIDRGGTFTDIWATAPRQPDLVFKLLSVDPSNYEDAPTEGIRVVLSTYGGTEIPRGVPLPKMRIESIRMGTTVATNALLERKGTKHAFLVTKGFKDLLDIGYQSRPHLFDLNIKKPEVLYSQVCEVEERVTIEGFDEDVDGQVCALEAVPGVLEHGLNGQLIRILKPLDEAGLKTQLQELRQNGYDTIAICFTHSYAFPMHEVRAGQLAVDTGFTHVSLSSQVAANMIKMVPRGSSASADAYLTPEIKRYLQGFQKGFEEGHLDDVCCEFMQSDGGLVRYDRFSGLKGILSGPAGGVVGYARTSFNTTTAIPIIGFDMGGTSTDVSRYGGTFEHVFETTTAGVTIQSPQLDINTVAAGGGSILTWKNGLFAVGPESASSHPGPACYRKNGPLTVTDANLFLGRLVPESFPRIFGPTENEPLDEDIVREKFLELTAKINAETGGSLSAEEIACGFLDVANEAMCRPIRALTEAKGHLVANHHLSVFGGAGGQHACDIASNLGIDTIIIHKYSSILSAYGMALADIIQEAQKPHSALYTSDSRSTLTTVFEDLETQVEAALLEQGIDKTSIYFEYYLNMRYQGTETAMMITESDKFDFQETFLQRHMQEFNFIFPEDRPILIDDVRVRGIGKSMGTLDGSVSLSDEQTTLKFSEITLKPDKTKVVYFKNHGGLLAPVYALQSLKPGSIIAGPAIIIDATQTIVIVPEAKAKILSSHVILDVTSAVKNNISDQVANPATLSVFGHRFMSIAEQMGRALQNTSVSLNIKERLDFSCAIFGADAGLVANAPHVPVHLGSMSYAVQFQHELLKGKLSPGDVLVSNHPEAGGTHLPDITVITPVFDEAGKEVVFYVASRGHHTDIGGLGGTSMPPNSTELWQEGAAIKSFKLIQNGVFDEKGITKILLEPGNYPGCNGSRRLSDNLSDLKAQVAANNKGLALVQALMRESSQETVQMYMSAIQENAEVAVRSFLKETLRVRGPVLASEDDMDNGSYIKLQITIQEDGNATFDFTGTSCELLGNMNAPPAITHSALLYSLRLLIGTDIPMNQGCLSPTRVILPSGCLLNPSDGPAVCAGNTQTSQRLVDVILKAFAVAGASQGCMNCLGFFGEGGRDSNGNPLAGFAYAFGETICGGSGATAEADGASGVHTHMTNTRITDPESLEKRYPVVLREFSIRKGSGGQGMRSGGDGVIRDIECRAPLKFSVMTERRVTSPYGMSGGEPGSRGANYWVKKNPDGSDRWINLGPKNMVAMSTGDRCIIQTPGGGGFGKIGCSLPPTTNVSKLHHPRAMGSIAAYATAQAESS
ncbi:putative 5-oxoprolinase (atp-hydrolysing) [Phaeomoniella chlamydospora]|uniref:Putative 5-oxoprolinase (Atp-hydrolysing) n=1 Tax=Phaeomoniella chlamydospora TaxID=158046 RepID=A0A0G2EE84_PHACM|nr:putative 5-oxoprolinase (atp-hydrolysing) [Phaeomoniella chlamydospora]